MGIHASIHVGYFFYYYIHTITIPPLLTRQLNFISELKQKVDNPRIKIVKYVGARTQDEKMRWNTAKTNRRNFKYIKNSQLLTWSLPTEEIFQVHGQNRPVANRPAVDFRSQPRERPLPKPLNIYGLSFHLLLSSLSRKVWMSLFVGGADFWSVLEAIIWKNSDKPSWIEDGEGFAVRSSTWPRDAKGE